MGEVQLWQSEGLGADRNTLERVINIFKTDGVQGMKSQQALDRYIKKLSDSSLREMYEIDEEAAIQILVDCFGAAAAFRKYALIAEYISVNLKELKEAGWFSPAAYAEVVGKYEKRTKRLEEERDGLLSKYANVIQRAENAEKQREELQNTLVHYKADLYDFYAQAGKIPKYERG